MLFSNSELFTTLVSVDFTSLLKNKEIKKSCFRQTDMSCFSFRTNSQISRSTSIFHGQFCCDSASCNHRHVPSRNLVVLGTRISAALHNTLCAPVSLPTQRSETNPFHRNLETAKLHRQGYTNNWLFDRIFHLLLHLDQSSMEMCLLQFLCPSSFQVKMSLQKLP